MKCSIHRIDHDEIMYKCAYQTFTGISKVDSGEYTVRWMARLKR